MNVFSFVKSRVSIVDVVNEYTTLKKAGTYLKSRCPFHHEKTGSFTVSPHKEIYYCFGCHAGGDVISFIAKVENCTQIEAVKFLAERFNLELPEESFDTQKHEEKQHYFDVCKAFARYTHAQLKKNPTVLNYLEKRGIGTQSINRFEIGYLPGGLSAIKQCLLALKNENILANDLLEANIIAQGKAIFYSPYEDRILFPITDHMGRYCGFGGRIWKPQDKRPKYYNSRENEWFAKGSILFGLDRAKKEVQKTGAVFLVEGYTDCTAMVEHGYANSVATLGTSCTLSHLKLLSRYAQYVYLLYDSDKAGQEAILRLAQLCWQANMELKVVHLPMGQDPASYLHAGNSLADRIEAAEDIFKFFINSLGNNFQLAPLSAQMERLATLIDTIQTIDDPLKQDVLLQTASRSFDIPFETLKRQLNLKNKSSEQRSASSSQEPIAADEPSTGPSKLEKRIFCAIVNNTNLLDKDNDNYVIDSLSSPLKEILQKVVEQKTDESSFACSPAFDTMSQAEKEYVSKLLLHHDERIDKDYFEQLLAQFQRQQWKQISRSITRQLLKAQQEGNTQTVQKILHDYSALKQKMFLPAQGKPRKE